MGNKFHIMWFDYPFKGYWEGDYQTDNILKFLFKLIKIIYTHNGVNVEVRW